MASTRFRRLRISLFGMLVLTPFWAVLVGWIYSGWHQRQVVVSLEEEGWTLVTERLMINLSVILRTLRN